MEMTLFLISLALCFVLTVGQEVIPIAPTDAQDTCRFGFQTRGAHDWIPYVNETSDGVRGEVKWQVILDQFDYTNLIGPGTPIGPWQVRDFDGDSITVCVACVVPSNFHWTMQVQIMIIVEPSCHK